MISKNRAASHVREAIKIARDFLLVHTPTFAVYHSFRLNQAPGTKIRPTRSTLTLQLSTPNKFT
jgi:hypothetical protein